jgi:hypothetical protein
MDPKGKGKVTNDKKEVLSGDTPKGGEIVNPGSGKNKKDRKKNKVYYDNDACSSSPKDDDNFKKKVVKQNYFKMSFNYSRIPYGSNAHLLSISWQASSL